MRPKGMPTIGRIAAGRLRMPKIRDTELMGSDCCSTGFGCDVVPGWVWNWVVCAVAVEGEVADGSDD